MYTKQFWRAARERALFSFAQALLASPAGLLVINLLADIGSGNLNLVLLHRLGLHMLTWLIIATFTAGGSVLSSLVKARKDGNPSLDNVEVLAPEPSTRVTGGVIGNPGGPRGW